MASIEVPQDCVLCHKSFEHKEKITYISGATVFQKRKYPSLGKVMLRRHGGEAQKFAIHDECWRTAKLSFFNSKAVETNMAKCVELIGVLREEHKKVKS